MCTFSTDGERCTGCVCYGDCLDEAFEIIVQLPEPRTDGPLKHYPVAACVGASDGR
jgi:hypothetical protein